jgi:CheY-like chemotaxis protein
MKILIVEDDENKGVQISTFLHDTFPEATLQLERSLQSGLRRIRKELPGLVLLDMTLPTYDTGPDEPGGEPQIFGGQEFLRQIDRFEINVPVIVITQFETFGKPPKMLPQLDEELRAEHPTVYRGAVYYHPSIHGWKEKLRQLVETAIDTNQKRGGSNA